jgi:hypothetical protein
MRLDEIRPQLVSILQERPDEFWLAYTVWLRLNERFPEQAARIAAEYGGFEAVGEGGDVQFGPASYIAQSLRRFEPQVEVRRLFAKGLSVGEIKTSYEWLSVYRWCGE